MFTFDQLIRETEEPEATLTNAQKHEVYVLAKQIYLENTIGKYDETHLRYRLKGMCEAIAFAGLKLKLPGLVFANDPAMLCIEVNLKTLFPDFYAHRPEASMETTGYWWDTDDTDVRFQLFDLLINETADEKATL